MTESKIILRLSSLLDNERRILFKERGWPYPDLETVKAQDKICKEWWKEFNSDNKIINKISELTGVVLPYPIEAYVIGKGLAYSMSTPLIMQIFKRDDTAITRNDFIELIVHEVIHRFVGDTQMNPQTEPYWDFVREKYKNESRKTQNHIMVYAVLIKILGEFNKPSLDLIPERIEKYPDYKKAFEIAEKEEADAVIEEFKNHQKQ